MFEIIHKLVSEHIKCDYVVVDGDGVHFELTAVSQAFTGKNLIARHRIIYDAIGDKMKQEIHALSMKLYTPEEWAQQQ
jgi:acid stress-induced BolA-like protein IbaG/YrbA